MNRLPKKHGIELEFSEKLYLVQKRQTNQSDETFPISLKLQIILSVENFGAYNGRLVIFDTLIVFNHSAIWEPTIFRSNEWSPF